METGTDPAVLALISTLFVLMIGNFWQQSRENTKTRDLIVSTNAETRTELHREIKEVGDQLHREIKEVDDQLHREIKEVDNHVRSFSTELAKLGGQFAEFKLATEHHQRQTEQNYKELRDGLVDNRERLTRIEGHLGIAPAPVE
ncbi:MAG: hypothetical protein OXF75_11870 [Acidimicrobiaceae bacterium]|nr:hypothetical protein [Acidimicrobiaceae bacterium]